MSPNPKLIVRSARWTRWLVTALLAITIVLQLLTIVPGPIHIQMHGENSSTASAVLNHAHSLLVAVALFQLLLLLRHLERGELFTVGVTRRLRGFALFALLGVAAGSILPPLIAFFMAECLPEQSCDPHRAVDMRGLWMLLSALVFFLVARLLDEARRIDEDHRQIV